MYKRPVVTLGLVLVAATAHAHDGYHAEIAALEGDAGRGDVAALLSRSALHRRAGHVMEAYVDAENAVLGAPDQPSAYLERGLALATLGASASATDDLDAYLEAGGRSVEALVARAELAREASQLSLARGLYDAAIELSPRPDLVLERGQIDLDLGQLDAAASGYEQGMKLLAGAHVIRRALLRVELARRSYDRAEALADEALAAAPSNPEWLLERGDVRAARGDAAGAKADRQAALDAVDESLQRRPTELKRALRGRALLALGAKEDAERELAGVMERAGPIADVEALLASCRGGAR